MGGENCTVLRLRLMHKLACLKGTLVIENQVFVNIYFLYYGFIYQTKFQTIWSKIKKRFPKKVPQKTFKKKSPPPISVRMFFWVQAWMGMHYIPQWYFHERVTYVPSNFIDFGMEFYIFHNHCLFDYELSLHAASH